MFKITKYIGILVTGLLRESRSLAACGQLDRGPEQGEEADNRVCCVHLQLTPVPSFNKRGNRPRSSGSSTGTSAL